MKLIEFKEQTVVIAKDHPEYQPLPAFQFANDPTGRVVCCWKLSLWERLRLLFTGKLWHTVMAFHHPLQPQLLELKKPFTAGDVAAAAEEELKNLRLKDFQNDMRIKYGEAAQKKKAHMDALNYHPNDRRRTIKFDAEDFKQAQEHGLLFLHGCRVT